MRTQEEIVKRIRERQPEDFLGFEIPDYLGALTRETAEGLRGDILKPDADVSDWKPTYSTDEEVRAEAIRYMEFAFGKAHGERGISAGRSLMHYRAWLWLIGEDQFEDIEDAADGYGQNQLRRVCEFLGIDPKEHGDF